MGELPAEQIALKATGDNYERFITFISSHLLRGEIAASDRIPILTACEELIVNITRFAFTGRDGMLSITVEQTPHDVSITLVDDGIPFNPLERPDPDISLPPEKRRPGGFGIFLVKNLMDTVEYAHKDNRNIVRITRRVSGTPRA